LKDGGSHRGLLVRADADAYLGTGHVMRCLALAAEWQARFGTVVMLSRCTVNKVQQRVEEARIPFISLDGAHPDRSDLIKAIEIAKRTGCEWVVLDGYHFDQEYQKGVFDAGLRLLVIDDMAHHRIYYADILLNQNIHAERLNYSCNSEVLLLLGPKYSLLRREFLAWCGWQRDIPRFASKILVTMGGSDPPNQTLKVIRAISRLEGSGLEARVVIGAGNPHVDSLKTAITGIKSIHLVEDVIDMPKLMAWADLAISAGGSTCWELAYMGLPTVIIVLSENQWSIGEGLHQAGISWNLGRYESVTEDQICQTLLSLISNEERRIEMSKQGRSLIDGRGPERVVRAMEGIHETIPNR
jgi:UDP-2,4-diacetamido-2,4,6-trideoxy-beta-L-altropyranose hydrolase